MADAKTEKQKVQEITEKLEQGLKELFESEKYRTYLNTMSKFHNYSINNTLLIAMQKPDATLVAGYKAWQRNFERHVKKGEKGIRIFAPAPYKVKVEQDKIDPATNKPVLDENNNPIGFVGGAIYSSGLVDVLDGLPMSGMENAEYCMINAKTNQYIFNALPEKVSQEVDMEYMKKLCAELKDEKKGER